MARTACAPARLVRAIIIVGMGALGVAGCTSAQPEPRVPASDGRNAPGGCPLGVAGASVVAEETDDGDGPELPIDRRGR